LKKVLMVFFVILSLLLTWYAYRLLFKKGKEDVLALPRVQFDIFLVIDQSGSMKGDKMDPTPSDPEGIRVKAAHYFVDYLRYFSDPKSNNRISVINFGTDTPEPFQLPLAEVGKAEKVEEIKKKIEEHSLGYTNFYQALRKVEEFYKKGNIPKETRQPVVIIFTDGDPKDERHLTKEQYFREISEFVEKDLRNIRTEGSVRPINFEFFIIALDARGQYWHKDKDRWEKLAPKRTFMLKQADEEELETIYGKIIEALFSTQAGEWFDLETGSEKKISIPPYIEKIVVSVKKERKIKDQRLEILTPDGKILKEGASFKLSSGPGMNFYVLVEPDPGEWTLKLSPSGKVRVKQDFLPTKLQVKKPATIHPLGEPIELVASFLKSDGTPVIPLSRYPLSFSTSIKGPDGKTLQPRLVEDRGIKGLYRTMEKIPTRQEGVYEITFEVNVGAFLKTGNFVLSRNTIPIEVFPIVYLKSIQPSIKRDHSIYHPILFWRQNPLKVEGKLYREGKEILARDLADKNLDNLVLAQIEREYGKGSSNVSFLKYDEKLNLFQDTLYPQKRLWPGQYTLATKIEAIKPDGSKYLRQDENDFAVVYGYGIVGWVILLALIFYILVQIFWRTVRGPLRGEVYIGTISAKPRDILLYNKCRVVSRKRKFVIPWINTIRHDADKNPRVYCPTFYIIGTKHKMGDGRVEPAVTIFYRKFSIFPWWTKLYRGRGSTTISGFTVRWTH